MTIRTEAKFSDYAIALWNLPKPFDPDSPIKTNAKQYILAKNTDGEYHLILFFDLKPKMALSVTVPIRST